ncbi:MAG: hypothetical protein MUF59_02105 [Candidatus Krumholzibacteria bacterium]|nr:hypothetical protein [Candidatus Krumholzibacteria bacterium]
MESNLLNHSIEIDGTNLDWSGLGVLIDEKTGSRVAVANDETDLYLRFATVDAGIQAQVLKYGLIVWFDGRGGKRRSFGVKYPMKPVMENSESEDYGDGGVPEGREFSTPGDRDVGVGKQKPGRRPPDPPDIGKLLALVPEALEIIGPGENMRMLKNLKQARQSGIFVSLEQKEGELIYEIRVPLREWNGSIYHVQTDEKRVVGIGLSAGRPESVSGRPGMGGGMPEGMDGGGMGGGRPGGPGGGFEGPGGGPGGGPPGTNPGGTIHNYLDLWLKVRLATG